MPVQSRREKCPCSVSSNGVASNSIQCTKCKQWVHARCRRVKGKLAEVKDFVCNSCSSPPLDTCEEEENIVIGNSSYEAVQQFCYLGDMLSTVVGLKQAPPLAQGVLGRSFASCFPSYLHVPSPWSRKAPSTKHVWEQCNIWKRNMASKRRSSGNAAPHWDVHAALDVTCHI